IFVAQKLQGLINTMMSTVGEMPIDKVTVIDRDLAANGSNFAVKAAVTAEQIKQMMGVDLAGIAQRAGGAINPTPAALPPAAPPPAAEPGPGQPPGPLSGSRRTAGRDAPTGGPSSSSPRASRPPPGPPQRRPRST